MRALRRTKNFVAHRSPRGVRITATVPGVYPKSRVISVHDWNTYMNTLSDKEFEGAAVFDYGIAVFAR